MRCMSKDKFLALSNEAVIALGKPSPPHLSASKLFPSSEDLEKATILERVQRFDDLQKHLDTSVLACKYGRGC